MPSGRLGAIIVGGVALAMTLTACAGGGSAGSSSSSRLEVVASTDVYGDIAQQIAGGDAGVTSIITGSAMDPHSYQANAQNELALSKADIVIENGGGYDDFIDTMLKSLPGSKADIINVVELSGKKAPAGGELNEHVWYDLPTMSKLADRLATALTERDPARASVFKDNAATFKQHLQLLESAEASIKQAHEGEGVAITEPVPLYMLEACGLDNKTPAKFSAAVEEGAALPPSVLAQTLKLFTGRQVKLLVYNAQASDKQTEQVRKAATANGIPVVAVTETLPKGKHYLGWMSDTVSAIRSALG